MNKKIIITGAYGFLGRSCAASFAAAGFEIYGIGHGGWPPSEYGEFGIKTWLSSDITYESLCSLGLSGRVSAVIHCGGGSSVAYSIENPSLDYKKTVDSTLAVLEYMRRENPRARLVYPSSTAVYGVCEDAPITEGHRLNPLSPYGFNKAAAELLCESYHKNYSVKCSIIRFFSIYGEGLKKQLLWEACNKIINASAGAGALEFFGTGLETRDWIHISDAAALAVKAAFSGRGYEIINGGSGVKTSIKDTIALISKEFEKYNIPARPVEFNNIVRAGDPAYYWADIQRALETGWTPKVSLAEGAARYVEWFVNSKNTIKV
jgi:UDP-glucose 4-epimerase